VNDPVLRVLMSRQTMADQGYSKGLLLSGAAHVTTFVALLILTLLTPSRKIINVIDGFAVPLPRGGGMPKVAEPIAAPVEEAPPAPAEAPKPVEKAPAPVKLIKPETAIVKKGLAPVDLKRSVKEPKIRESREIATERIAASKPQKSAPPQTAGSASASTGLDFIAQEPGVINGTSGPTGPLGFYLAAAQNKIWATWARQIRSDFPGSVKVAFTIHRDGAVDQVEVIESSGSATIDRLAERAILSTQLGPLPNAYEKETLVVHANFKPVS
jgi:TonB family protein